MIKGLEVSKPSQREVILNELQDSTHEFYLTGSRFFGNCREDSDYDFFTDIETSEDYLRSLGFSHRPSITYNDLNLIRVFTHPSGIDIQFIRDLKSKIVAQNIIRDFDLLMTIPKSQHRFIWNKVYSSIRI